MATVAVYNMQGAEVGKMDLNDAIFGVIVNWDFGNFVGYGQPAGSAPGT